MLTKTQHTQLIVLIDPDKYNPQLVELANSCKVSYFFVGGSVLQRNNFEKVIKSIKSLSKIPVIIFPGDEKQLSKHADGLLIISLISGRNPDYLIGKHVLVAKKIKALSLKTVPIGYILVNGKKTSTTQKVTKTKTLSSVKDIINTAIAGELLGKKLIYLEAGSGAKKTIMPGLIKQIKQQITIPLIVGGGIDSLKKAKELINEKPDYLVVGNALEKNPNLILELNTLF